MSSFYSAPQHRPPSDFNTTKPNNAATSSYQPAARPTTTYIDASGNYTPQVKESLDFIKQYTRGASTARSSGAVPSFDHGPSNVMVSPAVTNNAGRSTSPGWASSQPAPYQTVVRAPSHDRDAAGHRLGPGGRSPPRVDHQTTYTEQQSQLKRIIDGGAQRTTPVTSSIWSRANQAQQEEMLPMSPPPPPLPSHSFSSLTPPPSAAAHSSYTSSRLQVIPLADDSAAPPKPQSRSIWASASEMRADEPLRLGQSARHHTGMSYLNQSQSTFHDTDRAPTATHLDGISFGSGAPPLSHEENPVPPYQATNTSIWSTHRDPPPPPLPAAGSYDSDASWAQPIPSRAAPPKPIAVPPTPTSVTWGQLQETAKPASPAVTQQPQRRSLFSVPTASTRPLQTFEPPRADPPPPPAAVTSLSRPLLYQPPPPPPSQPTPLSTLQPSTSSANRTSLSMDDLCKALHGVDLDVALAAMIKFLKGQYANSPSEDDLPISSMEPDDVLALSQCFHAEMNRVVELHRMGAVPPPPPPPPPPTAARLGQSQRRFAALDSDEEASPVRPLSEAVRPAERPPEPSSMQTMEPRPTVIPIVKPPSVSHSAPAPGLTEPAAPPPPPPPPPPAQNTRDGTLGLPPMAPAAPKPAAEDDFAPRVSRRGASPAHSRSGSTVDESSMIQPKTKTRSASPSAVAGSFSTLMPKMKEGCDLVKYGRNGSPQLRFFRVVIKDMKVGTGQTAKMAYLCWGKNAKSSPSGELPLIELLDVTQGAVTPNFKRNSNHAVVGVRGETVAPQQCFTLTFSERTVDLYAPGAEEFDTWFRGMKLVVQRNKELENEATEAEAAQARAAAVTSRSLGTKSHGAPEEL